MRAAWLANSGFPGRYSVSYGEDGGMEVQFAELRSDVRHIQSDATDIKASVRDANNGLVVLREKLEQNGTELSKRVDATGSTVGTKFDELVVRVDGVRRELSERSDDARAELGAKIEGMATRMDNERKDLTARMDAVRTELGAKFERVAASVEKLSGDLAAQGTRLDGKITEVGQRLDQAANRLDGKIDALGKRLDGRIDDLAKRVDTNHKELTDKIDGVKADLWKARLWAIGLHIVLAASLLGVMARGFHWI